MYIKQNQFIHVKTRKQTSTHTHHNINIKVTKLNQNLVIRKLQIPKKK